MELQRELFGRRLAFSLVKAKFQKSKYSIKYKIKISLQDNDNETSLAFQKSKRSKSQMQNNPRLSNHESKEDVERKEESLNIKITKVQALKNLITNLGNLKNQPYENQKQNRKAQLSKQSRTGEHKFFMKPSSIFEDKKYQSIQLEAPFQNTLREKKVKFKFKIFKRDVFHLSSNRNIFKKQALRQYRTLYQYQPDKSQIHSTERKSPKLIKLNTIIRLNEVPNSQYVLDTSQQDIKQQQNTHYLNKFLKSIVNNDESQIDSFVALEMNCFKDINEKRRQIILREKKLKKLLH